MRKTERNWDRMAQAYEQFTSGDDSYSRTIEWPCIQKMLPALEGKSVVDLGCGTGRFTFWLEEENPARIVGVDLSEEMLRLARIKSGERNSRAEFVKADLSQWRPGETFDFVFSSTTTHYLPDLHAFFGQVAGMLKEQGMCVFSVMNPVYTAQYPMKMGNRFPEEAEWTVRYLDKRERAYIQPWIEYDENLDNFLSFSYHHTFSDYINAIAQAGLRITQAQEPLPPEKWKVVCPERYDSFLETPSYFVFKAQKR